MSRTAPHVPLPRVWMLLIACVMVFSASVGLSAKPVAAAGIASPLLLPFASGHVWHICQGYEGPTHASGLALDIGWTPASCTYGNNDTKDKPITAPWYGKIIKVPDGSALGDFICLRLVGGGSVALSHVSPRSAYSVGSEVAPGEWIANVKGAGSTNGSIAHLHLEAFSGDTCYSGTAYAFTGLARMQCAPPLPVSGGTYPKGVTLERLHHSVAGGGTPFLDICNSGFRPSIAWAWGADVAKGCAADRFCPDKPVRRDEMASFLARYLNLPAATRDYFTDVAGNPHEADINRVAAAGITSGCGAGKYCPARNITRGEMAAFLVRAFKLPGTTTNYFDDDNGHPFENQINALARSGITSGCATRKFCPDQSVPREQMVTFLHRHATR